VEDGRAVLRYRRGNDATGIYPEVARALAALPYGRVIMDGEVVVLDDQGRPSFPPLQQRAMLQRSLDIERATVDLTATLYLFDLPAFEDFDLRPLPLAARKALLARLVPRVGPLRLATHIDQQGVALFEEISARGLEGIMAKKADSPYRGGRFPDWLKI